MNAGYTGIDKRIAFAGFINGPENSDDIFVRIGNDGREIAGYTTAQQVMRCINNICNGECRKIEVYPVDAIDLQVNQAGADKAFRAACFPFGNG